MQYLLTMDVGNTHIKMQLMNGSEATGTFRLTTKMTRTSDEYGICLREFLNTYSVRKEQLIDVVISSVVPKIMYSLTSAVRLNVYFIEPRANTHLYFAPFSSPAIAPPSMKLPGPNFSTPPIE